MATKKTATFTKKPKKTVILTKKMTQMVPGRYVQGKGKKQA